MDGVQFGFAEGGGTTNRILIVRQMQERFGAEEGRLCFGFMDRVPKELIRWAMHKLGVEEWLVLAVMSMYTGAKTVVRTVYVTVTVLR